MPTTIRLNPKPLLWARLGSIRSGMDLTVVVFAILVLSVLGLWAGIDYVQELQVNALNAQSRVYGLKLDESFNRVEQRIRGQSRSLGNAREFKSPIHELLQEAPYILRAELRKIEGQLLAEHDRAMEKPIWPVLSRITPPPSQLLAIEQAIRLNKVGWSRSWAPNGEAFIEMIIPLQETESAIVLISPIWSVLPPFSGIDAQVDDYDFAVTSLHASAPNTATLNLPDLNLAVAISPKHSSGFNFIFLDSRGKFILIISALLIVLLVKNLLDSRAHQQSLALIEQQAQALEKFSQSQAINELTSTLAHEINQPLATIVNLIATCEVKISTASEPQDIQKALAQARGEAMRAADIVHSLRGWFKQEQISLEVIQVHKVFERLKPILDFIGQQQQSKILIRESVAAHIKADPLLLELAILNLVKNGLEAMKDVHVNDRLIILRSRLLDAHFDVNQNLIPQRLEISVEDQGAGIAAEVEASIFDFSFSTKAQGMGIGLSFCKNFAERIGGTLKWERNPDQGVTFRLVLPVTSPEATS